MTISSTTENIVVLMFLSRFNEKYAATLPRFRKEDLQYVYYSYTYKNTVFEMFINTTPITTLILSACSGGQLASHKTDYKLLDTGKLMYPSCLENSVKHLTIWLP